jgi:predicted porin
MMKRNLMALAVAGVFAAPAMAAQTSTVQIYGKVTAEYGYADQGAGRPSTDIFQTPGGSSVGFRGEEKLGGGLSAWFQCESSADVRGVGQDGFCSRNSAIGFKGSFGNLHFGRWDTPFKRSQVGKNGMEGTGLFGSAFLLTGSSTSTGALGGQGFSQNLQRHVWARRESAQIYSESPKFSGFQVLASFTPANATRVTDATVNAKPRLYSIGGTYSNGPLKIGAGYEKHSDFGTGFAGTGSDDTGWGIGASYTFAGKVEVGAQYIDTKYEMGAGGDVKRKSWQVGAEWNIQGPHNLDVAYVAADDAKGLLGATPGGNVPAVSLASTGADLWSISYRHVFSKRTYVRVGYVKLSNDQAASYALGGLRAPTRAGENQDAFAVYASHRW